MTTLFVNVLWCDVTGMFPHLYGILCFLIHRPVFVLELYYVERVRTY